MRNVYAMNRDFCYNNQISIFDKKGLTVVFKKQFFPEATIQTLATNSTVFKRGKEIYLKKLVGVPNVDEKLRTIAFPVQGTKRYNVNLRFYPNGVARKYHCTCPAFQKYSGACKHVVATMLQLNGIDQEDLTKAAFQRSSGLNNSPAAIPSYRKSDEALRKLITASKKELSASTISHMKELLNTEFILNISGANYTASYEMFMKVGTDHLYIVKNIPHVILQLLEGEKHEFGKNLTFDPAKHSITSEDRKLMEVMYDVFQLVRSATPEGYSGSYTNKSELEIPAQYLKIVLNALKETDGGFIRFGMPPRYFSHMDKLEQPQVEVEVDKFPLAFELKRENNKYLFSLTEEFVDDIDLKFHQGANIIEWHHKLYFVNAKQFRILKSLMEALKEINNQSLVLRSKDLTEFASTVLPQISSFVSVTVSDEVQETVYQHPLEAQLYIDTQHQALLVRPVFKYKEISVYPLDEEPVKEHLDKVLVREIVRENDALSQAYHYLSSAKISEGRWELYSLEELSAFLYESLPDLSEYFDLFLSASARNLLYDPKVSPKISIEMNESSNLLDVSFEAEDIPAEDLRQLLKQLNQNKQYYRLSNGKIVNLKEQRFQELNATAEKMDIEPGEVSENMSVPVFQGLSVLEDDSVKKGMQFKQLAKRLLEPQTLAFDLPDHLDAKLRPYQETGYKWMKSLDHYGFGGVLADDMGLGKTVQTITFLLSKVQEENGKYLIICPSSVLYNWQHEFHKFAPTISTALISGSAEERKQVVKDSLEKNVSVLITSYPLIQRDSELYEDHTFKTIILDESQNVKNTNAKTTQAVRRLKATNKLALSGTPIENNLGELWSLFSIIQPGLFKTRKAYKQMDQDQIAAKIKPFILRRLKREVLDDLPPKTETTEYIELSEPQKRLYQTQLAMIRQEVKGLIENDTFETNRIRVLAGMTRLRQICCDPHLIMNNFEGESSKLNRLLEYLEEARVNGKRVVLFSQFTQMLSIIRKTLDQEGADYHYLDGQTKKEDRLELTTRFNTGEKDLFLISLKAGGTGLNLTGGDTVILYDSWWNPAIEDQAADRVHRFGQKKAVQVIRLITEGTIEERINELQDKKRELIDSVIESGNERSISSLSKEEVLSLLNE